MNVRDAMSEAVATCRPADRDARAAQLLWEHDCGALPVVDEAGRAVGMVTDRDLCMAAYTRGRSLHELAVAEAMSGELFGCRLDDSLPDALAVMRDHRVRRLPVLDGDGRVAGILSLADVVRAARNGQARPRGRLLDAIVETLEAVGEPRGKELVPQPRRPRAAKPATPAAKKPAAKKRAPRRR